MNTDQKKCFKCGGVKPRTEFYRHNRMADGLLGKCKECTKADVRKHRCENDSVREYDRRRGNRQSAEYRRRYKERFPAKSKAQNAVNNAVRDGRLAKPDCCQECGSTFAIHGHHDDYAKPLEVRWLCALCHRRWHSEHGEALNAGGGTHAQR